MIGDIKKFRFWCQKVIPLVYDNSLSYYEVLCKVVDYLNKVIEDMNEIPSYIDAKIEEALDDEHLKELIEEVVANIESSISSNNEHDNTNSSADYNIGQLLWWNGKLYKVIRHIDAGDTFIVNTNIELVNFEDLFNNFIDEIKHCITANDDGNNTTASQNWEAGTWVWLNDVLYAVLSDITQGNAYVFTGDNANVEAITVESEVDMIASMANQNKADINELNSGITTINENIGDLTELETTDKTSVVNAINSVMEDVTGSLVITSPEKFGAIGDGVTDDTEACQNAIDDAIANKKKLLFTQKYKVSTLYIKDSIEIDGGGTLYGNSIRYDNITSELNNTNKCFTTQHPEYYHPNTIICVHNGENYYQTLVVDRVENDTVYVETHFYENATTSIVTFDAGSVVNIYNVIFEIVANNKYLANDVVIDNVNIRNINIIGSQSGYDANNFIIFDGRYTGLIFAHSVKDSWLESNNMHTCLCNAVGYLGTCTNVHIVDNYIAHCHSSFEATTETEVAMAFHWSQRFIGSAYTASRCVISGNVIEDCYDGIFLSATSYMTVSNNNLRNINYRGLMVYAGDNNYANRNHVIDGNTFYNCSGANNVATIYLSNAIQSIISNNNISNCNNGVAIGKGDDCLICGNEFIGCSNIGIPIYNGYRNTIKDNYFLGNSVSDILINKQDTGNSYLTIDSNTHNGTKSSGGAIDIENGAAIKILNEVCHGTPTYLLKVNTTNVTLGSVLVMNSYVNAGLALSAELAVLNYIGCVNSSNARVENIT